MNRLDLSGDWLLYYLPGGKLSIQQPDQLLSSELTPVPAMVPGNVELDLQRARVDLPGLQPDPFYGRNIRQLRDLEDHEWWYVKNFHMPPSGNADPFELVFEGLDTLGTIWLNDTLVGQAENMLVTHRFDVSSVLKYGDENQVVVRLRSATRQARQLTFEPGMISWEHRFEGLQIRKAPHVWGWDIMPRAVSAGIWRPVYLQAKPPNRFDWIYFWTASIHPGGAELGVRFSIHTEEELDGMTLKLHGTCQEHQFEYEWPLEFTADGFRIPIPAARLWWPAGYGEPNLYTVTTSLCKDGRILAQRQDRVGIRSLKVDRTETAGAAWSPAASGFPARHDTPPHPDAHFVFYVNNHPIMVKGTNWVPLDAYHSRDVQRLAGALDLVAELGCNMIRCWGGNVYESDAFFDWCDSHGVMVWQDFAFACCIYPQTEAFLEKVRVEVEQVVSRLRNHACLALWCGDNEIDMVYQAEGRDPGLNRITRQVIPQVIERLDPSRDYLPSSPYVPPAMARGREAWMNTPEQHLWGPRGYFKSDFYTRHNANFIGEMGYHGCPHPESVRRFISPQAQWPPQDNVEWQLHAVYHWNHSAIDRDRIQLMINQVREYFGDVPDDLESFAFASQFVQAEADKFFIESTRMRKWVTSGILWWNLIDGWPQFSDAVVDYYFNKKLAFEVIRRAQAPVCVLIGEAGDGKYLPVVISNDSLQDHRVSYRIWDADDGEAVIEGELTIPANQNWQVARLRTFASEKRLYLIEWAFAGSSHYNHYLAGTPPFDFHQVQTWQKKISALTSQEKSGNLAEMLQD